MQHSQSGGAALFKNEQQQQQLQQGECSSRQVRCSFQQSGNAFLMLAGRQAGAARSLLT